MNALTVRELQIGETLTSWCLWNTKNGLERIPKSKIGEKLKFKNPRDIFFEIENANTEQETRVCDEWIVTKLFPSEKEKVNENNRIDDIPELIFVGEYSKIGEWDTVNSIFKVVEKFFAVRRVKKS